MNVRRPKCALAAATLLKTLWAVLRVGELQRTRLSAPLFSSHVSKALETIHPNGCAMRRLSTGHRSVRPQFSISDHPQTKDVLSISRWR